MKEKGLITSLHKRTTRDYFARMSSDKPHCMDVAKSYGSDYWDGERRYGYGGYTYDGRWRSCAQEMISLYHLDQKSSVLDLGCGKAHLLYEMKRLLPGLRVLGVDISEYALSQVPEEIHKEVRPLDLRETPWPFEDGEFDLVLSLNVFHNFHLAALMAALSEMERVGKNKYLAVESYRNEKELTHLQCWALTCASFYHVTDWRHLMKLQGYSGDYEFIFFE